MPVIIDGHNLLHSIQKDDSWHGLPARESTARLVPSGAEGMAVSPISLGTAPTKDLSVEAIGFDYGMCFTGVYFGIYATGNGQKCTTPADFDWFEYKNTDEHGQ